MRRVVGLFWLALASADQGVASDPATETPHHFGAIPAHEDAQHVIAPPNQQQDIPTHGYQPQVALEEGFTELSHRGSTPREHEQMQIAGEILAGQVGAVPGQGQGDREEHDHFQQYAEATRQHEVQVPHHGEAEGRYAALKIDKHSETMPIEGVVGEQTAETLDHERQYVQVAAERDDERQRLADDQLREAERLRQRIERETEQQQRADEEETERKKEQQRQEELEWEKVQQQQAAEEKALQDQKKKEQQQREEELEWERVQQQQAEEEKALQQQRKKEQQQREEELQQREAEENALREQRKKEQQQKDEGLEWERVQQQQAAEEKAIQEQKRKEQQQREELEDMQEQERLYQQQLEEAKREETRRSNEAALKEAERLNNQQSRPEVPHSQPASVGQAQSHSRPATKAAGTSSERHPRTEKKAVLSRLCHVVFHFTDTSDIPSLLSLANDLMNRGHKVGYAGDMSILRTVMALTSVEDDSQFFIIEDVQRVPGISHDQLLYAALPRALSPGLAMLPWFGTTASPASFESLKQQLSSSKQPVDVLVADSFAVSALDAAEALGVRTAIFHSAPVAWMGSSETAFALPFAERVVSRLWERIAPFARLIPTAFVNYQRFTRGLPLLGDVTDYWGRTLNLVTSAALLPSNYRAIGSLARPEPLLANDTRVLDFVSEREAQGLPVVYVNFGTSWLEPRLIEAILWGLTDSRWAVVMNLPAPMEAALHKDNLPNDRKGTKYVLCSFDAHVQVLQHRNVKVFLSHGGSELINSALLFGVPSLLIPLSAAQASQALSLQQQGAAIAVTSERQLASVIADSVWKLLSEPQIRHNAERLGLSLRPIPEEAVLLLEQVVAGEFDVSSTGELSLPLWRRWDLDVWGSCLLVFLAVWFLTGVLGQLFASCWDLCCPQICCCLCCFFKPKAHQKPKQATKPVVLSSAGGGNTSLAAKKLQ